MLSAGIAALVVTRIHVKHVNCQQILLAVIYLTLCFARPTTAQTDNMLMHYLILVRTVPKTVLYVNLLTSALNVMIRFMPIIKDNAKNVILHVRLAAISSNVIQNVKMVSG